MLSDKWFNDGECFTRTRSTNTPSSYEWIYYVYPTFTEFTLVVTLFFDAVCVHRLLLII